MRDADETRTDEDLRELRDLSQTGPVPATGLGGRTNETHEPREGRGQLGRDTVTVLLDAINEQGRRMEAQVEKVRADVSGLRQLMYRELPREYIPRQELAGRLERIERDLRDHQQDLEALREQLGLSRLETRDRTAQVEREAGTQISSQRSLLDGRWIGLLQALLLMLGAALMAWLMRGR